MTPATQKPALNLLILTALGVVFGDLGTSPLYTLKTVLQLAGSTTQAAVLGLLSLLIWTLVIITSVKYVFVVMRVDNDGEGGILALMSLLGVQRARRREERQAENGKDGDPETVMRHGKLNLRPERAFLVVGT